MNTKDEISFSVGRNAWNEVSDFIWYATENKLRTLVGINIRDIVGNSIRGSIWGATDRAIKLIDLI